MTQSESLNSTSDVIEVDASSVNPIILRSILPPSLIPLKPDKVLVKRVPVKRNFPTYRIPLPMW